MATGREKKGERVGNREGFEGREGCTLFGDVFLEMLLCLGELPTSSSSLWRRRERTCEFKNKSARKYSQRDESGKSGKKYTWQSATGPRHVMTSELIFREGPSTHGELDDGRAARLLVLDDDLVNGRHDLHFFTIGEAVLLKKRMGEGGGRGRGGME